MPVARHRHDIVHVRSFGRSPVLDRGGDHLEHADRGGDQGALSRIALAVAGAVFTVALAQAALAE